MRLIELHNEGGMFFMSILSLLFLVILGLSIQMVLKVFKDDPAVDSIKVREELKRIVQIGLFALVWGIFGQCIGLFQAFIAIEEAGDVSFALMVGGLKVSMITTLYGFIIFLTSYVIWFGLKIKT